MRPLPESANVSPRTPYRTHGAARESADAATSPRTRRFDAVLEALPVAIKHEPSTLHALSAAPAAAASNPKQAVQHNGWPTANVLRRSMASLAQNGFDEGASSVNAEADGSVQMPAIVIPPSALIADGPSQRSKDPEIADLAPPSRKLLDWSLGLGAGSPEKTSSPEPFHIAVKTETHLAPSFASPSTQCLTLIGDVATDMRAEAASRAATPAVPAPLTRIVVLALEPDALGPVGVRLKLSAGRLDIQIEATTRAATDALVKDRDTLADALGAGGYEINSLVVQPAMQASAAQSPSGDSAGADRFSFAAGNSASNTNGEPGHRRGDEPPSPPQKEVTYDSRSDRAVQRGVFL